jgi:hypothetical protein
VKLSYSEIARGAGSIGDTVPT